MAMPRVVSCPTCGSQVTWGAGSPFRPFCSERCKLIDLGAWADERYRVPIVEPDDDEQSAGDMPPDRGRAD
ncbi:MAG: DNA gyrase inhibitor YacG [Betaproteobacteria bacterium]